MNPDPFLVRVLPFLLVVGSGSVPAEEGLPSAQDIAAAVAPMPSLAPEGPAPLPTRPATPLDSTLPEAAQDTAADTPVVWQGDPIPLALQVGVERRIDFPEALAEVDVPRALEQQSRIVVTPSGSLHWTANTPFSPTRVLATSVSGSLYQFDVQAQADGEVPKRLVLNDPVVDAAARAAANAPSTRAQREQAAARLIPDFLTGGPHPSSTPDKPSYVALARFALAHFTGPARLIPQLEAERIAVRPIDTQAWLRVHAAVLTLQPLAQWKVQDRYVTAIQVRNRGAMDVAFDPRALRGDWQFAAALHPTLQPQGSGHNQTLWIVITSQPFNRVLDHGPARTVSR
ncbi:MAG: DUF3438 family protein [Candidatus Competibacteraceae bacterium]|nr:DUF3438 family protein [Candidatus Competibacteraceae bacterium]